MVSAVEMWERYAARAQPRRAVNATGATTWLNWTQYSDHGPDEAILGDVEGRAVLELGSGRGANLAHLATLGARCTGVDLASTRTTDAKRTWSHLPNLEFVTADAIDYLSKASARFDVVYSIFGAVWFTEPEVLLPLVRSRMTPGGVLVFSHLPAAGPAAADQALRRWDLPAEQWVRLLAAAGFASVSAEVIPGPANERIGTLLVRAHAECPDGTDPGFDPRIVNPNR